MAAECFTASERLLHDMHKESSSKMLKINDYLVNKGHPTIYYVPDFVSREEEIGLIEHIVEAPKPKWECLSNRRLQNWGGLVGKKALIQCNDIPAWLECLMDGLYKATDIFDAEHRPNHVLINEYTPGQGIMIENSSLQSRYAGSMLLQPRSLFVLTGDAYSGMLHGIAERKLDDLNDINIWNKLCLNEDLKDLVLERSQTRYSLTIRNVPKVSKLAMNSLLGNR